MMIKEFRITHSTLIEHYQFMESHLEGIYAAISGKHFWDGLKDVENDSLGELLGAIRHLEKVNHITVFSKEEHEQLRQIFRRRNFWCHNCYFDMPFDHRTGGPARIKDEYEMMQDLEDAKAWRDLLYNRKMEMIAQYRKSK